MRSWKHGFREQHPSSQSAALEKRTRKKPESIFHALQWIHSTQQCKNSVPLFTSSISIPALSNAALSCRTWRKIHTDIQVQWPWRIKRIHSPFKHLIFTLMGLEKSVRHGQTDRGVPHLSSSWILWYWVMNTDAHKEVGRWLQWHHVLKYYSDRGNEGDTQTEDIPAMPYLCVKKWVTLAFSV